MVGGLGEEKMHKLMPEIIQTAERMDIAPHVKDGYIMMFIYMPGVFPEQFRPYIGQVFSRQSKIHYNVFISGCATHPTSTCG